MLQWGPALRGPVLICRIRPWFSGCGGRTASRARCENCSSLISFVIRWPCCPQRLYYTISWGGCQYIAKRGLTRYTTMSIKREKRHKTWIDTSRSVCVGGYINIGAMERAMERRHWVSGRVIRGSALFESSETFHRPFHTPTYAFLTRVKSRRPRPPGRERGSGQFDLYLPFHRSIVLGGLCVSPVDNFRLPRTIRERWNAPFGD